MKAKIPHTYEEAFAILDRRLKKAEKIELAKNAYSLDTHFGLGLWIRNRWIYGQDGEYLCNEPERKDMIMLPADMESSNMIGRYQAYLRDKYNLLTDEENMERWRTLRNKFMEDCTKNPPVHEDVFSVEYLGDEGDDYLCRIEKITCYDGYSATELGDRIDVCVPASEFKNDVLKNIHWFERIIRHLKDPNTPDTPYELDPKATLWMFHDNLPDMKHGVVTVYDVAKQQMLITAYIRTEEFIYRSKDCIYDFTSYAVDDVKTDDIRSAELDEYFENYDPKNDYYYGC